MDDFYQGLYRTKYTCPVCGGPVNVYPDCPGYPGTWNGKPSIMVCSPACGNADEFLCMNTDCDWWYREPSNRGDKDTMGIRPEWLDDYLGGGEDDDEILA